MSRPPDDGSLPDAHFLADLPIYPSKAELYRALQEVYESLRLCRQEAAELRSQLSEVHAQLDGSRQIKHGFIALVNHELRTPFTTILGAAEVLAEQIPGPLNQKQLYFVENIDYAGRHLLHLINDLLDYNQLQAGNLVLDLRTIPVDLPCQAALLRVRADLERKQQIVYFDCRPTTIELAADLLRLQQMLFHLLRNASQFSPDGSVIRLQVAVLPAGDSPTAGPSGDLQEEGVDEGAVCFTVTDTGPGITGDDLQRLFQPFSPLDLRLDRTHTGLGLGLALVRGLAELHGGHIEVQSEVGHGSRFTITLPCHSLTPGEAA